ncbi:FGGY family carbohydrate kinase [Actinosynnema sp. NPDC047251]|uniref:Xylulose kinase n=1 Tax=Saccharothrix espanaensis (strain ATCC 51144 / DSM 44229 / JCM 9112 / NBRC 15066 / NRRL 15764) TaxID=1179773 RepID=K0JVA2_SACES|nr:FGGY family carbohydrate kinase [Saccharothrix espanaensis]CCH29916.1 Xylulose kinase [Saccharothrix espanaensis DSM 44229]
MTLVAGIDSSTQSCKVVVRDAESGVLVREGRAPHPPGTEVDPGAWWDALGVASRAAGGLDDVAAVSVAAQQHGLVCLDGSGVVVRPALLWNDTRSAGAARDLVAELGAAAWVAAVGNVPVASLTVAKLRWLAEHEPGNADRTAAVCLPHDWLTWRLSGGRGVESLTTDRSDASGTGYWSAAGGEYRLELLERAFGRVPTVVPSVLGPGALSGRFGAGCGDNAAAALGVQARPGDVVVSVGTSGTAFARASRPVADPTGTVNGFADAEGGHLPLVCTLNASRVLDAAAALLGVDLAELSRLASSAPAGADGLVLVPYLEGERTPDKPDSTGAVHGLRLDNATPGNFARAAVEGLLCGLADAIDALAAVGTPVERVLLIGGGARSAAVREIAPAVFGRPVVLPATGEYVADGAARQAAWALAGADAPPHWAELRSTVVEADPTPWVRERYATARDLTVNR